jgi:hypothetical protein
VKTRKLWNRCDVCGQLIAIKEFGYENGARITMLTPDAEGTAEAYEVLCAEHRLQTMRAP